MFKYFENKMRLSNQQRIESINGVKNKYFVVSNALKSLNIKFIILYINIINQVE